MKHTDVVSNTSPLIFLERIDSLDLLRQCFDRIYIPEGVKNEWGAESIPSFISVHSISEIGKSYVKGAIGRLHKAELEAIQLAIELKCKVILLDDLLARRIAKKKELVPLGVLGVLKIACKLELMPLTEVKLKVSELINNHGFFITSNILNQYFDSF
jgi:predicted nucleic acid-binding protein